MASGDGDGVRASGDSGILCTDLRRLVELVACFILCLCLRPCSVLGRELKLDAAAAGEFGRLDDGELLLDEFAVELAESEPDDQTRPSGGERGDVMAPAAACSEAAVCGATLSPVENERLSVW